MYARETAIDNRLCLCFGPYFLTTTTDFNSPFKGERTKAKNNKSAFKVKNLNIIACLFARLPTVVLFATGFIISPLYAGSALADTDLQDVLSGFDTTLPVALDDVDVSDGINAILDGFDGPLGTEPDNINEPPAPLQWLDPFGSLSIMGTWNFAHDTPSEGEADFRNLSMLRTTGALGVDIDLNSWQLRISGHGFYDAAYSIQGREQYTDDMLDDYGQEWEFDELNLAGDLTDDLDIKIGRQIVVWGKADNLRVTDILNPLDNRILGMVDIKYKRLPVAMSKLDYYSGPWNVSVIVINEVRFDKIPVYNSDFYPGNGPAVSDVEPTNFALDTQQYAMAVNGIFSGWDLSFYQAWVYDGRPHLTLKDSTPVREHNRVSMSGMTGNIAFGNWLFKGEGAWWNGLKYGAVSAKNFNRIDLMAGVEYTGFSETMLSLEFVNRHIIHYNQQLASPPDLTEQDVQQTVLMVSRDFFNDRTQAKLLCSFFDTTGDGGAFERLQLEHELSDAVSITGGIIFYQSGDLQAFSDLGGNDRIFLEYVYSF
ncbi:MAG: hypothetical protein COA36_08765 [Desulfotalea sp.]|nr:MAG: hypothetical protein COA36_08765 [Desulfotalea sp.]